MENVFYQNAYPVTAVAYSLYPIRHPDPANLAALRNCDLHCVVLRVTEHFEGSLRGQGLHSHGGRSYNIWERRVHETGASVDNLIKLERDPQAGDHPTEHRR